MSVCVASKRRGGVNAALENTRIRRELMSADSDAATAAAAQVHAHAPVKAPTDAASITTYNPDTIESYQFAVSPLGDIVVGVSGHDLVGVSIEPGAPSVSCFYQVLEQVGRCVTVAPNADTSSATATADGVTRRWTVMVGGDSKIVQTFSVVLQGHIVRCHPRGRIGPFPKRVQAVTVVHEAKAVALVADRFGDVYTALLNSDEVRVPAAHGTSPSHAHAPVDAAPAPTGPGPLRFALQHMGLISRVITVPVSVRTPDAAAGAPLTESPLVISCDSDFHVRVSCGRRPGLLLAHLWPQMAAPALPAPPAPATAGPASGDSAPLAAAASTAANTVLCLDFFRGAQRNSLAASAPDATASAAAEATAIVVAGRCDGSISLWAMRRRGDAVEGLDLLFAATCPATAAGSPAVPVVGVACLDVAGAPVVAFAKAGSNDVFAWRVSRAASGTADADSPSRRRGAPTDEEVVRGGTAVVAREQVQASLPAASSSSSSQVGAAPEPIVALLPAPSVSTSAFVVVYRDASVAVLELAAETRNQSTAQSEAAAFAVVFRRVSVPWHCSRSVPLPFTPDARAVVARAKAEALVSIVTDVISAPEWQGKFKQPDAHGRTNNRNGGAVPPSGGAGADAAAAGERDADDDEQDDDGNDGGDA